MKKIVINITLLVISFLPHIGAAQHLPGPLKAPTAPPAEETKLNKNLWIENIQKNLPVTLCQEGQYFMKCFDITQNECIDFNKLFLQACLNNVNLALPPEMRPQEISHWGSVVGKCTYDLFEKFVQVKKKTQPECHSPEKAKSHE